MKCKQQTLMYSYMHHYVCAVAKHFWNFAHVYFNTTPNKSNLNIYTESCDDNEDYDDK
jgi:hypothetical protein